MMELELLKVGTLALGHPVESLFPHRRRIIILIRRRMQIFRGLIATARNSGDEGERGKRRQRGRRGGR